MSGKLRNRVDEASHLYDPTHRVQRTKLLSHDGYQLKSGGPGGLMRLFWCHIPTDLPNDVPHAFAGEKEQVASPHGMYVVACRNRYLRQFNAEVAQAFDWGGYDYFVGAVTLAQYCFSRLAPLCPP